MQIRSAAHAIRCNHTYPEAMKPMVDALKAGAADIATTPQELNDAMGITHGLRDGVGQVPGGVAADNRESCI